MTGRLKNLCLLLAARQLYMPLHNFLSCKLDVFARMLRLHFEQGMDPKLSQLQSASLAHQRARTASHHFLSVVVPNCDPKPTPGLHLVSGLDLLHGGHPGALEWLDVHAAPWSASAP